MRLRQRGPCFLCPREDGALPPLGVYVHLRSEALQLCLRLQQRLHFGLPLGLHRHLRCVLGLCLLRRLPRLVEHADARRLGRRLCEPR